MTAEADQIEALWEAKALIVSAIALLDKAGAPQQIAAHLDLAHHQLATVIETGELGARRRHCGGPSH